MGKQRKCPAPRPHSRVNEIYVTRSKPLHIYTNRARKLLQEGHCELVIHGLGMAIPRAVEVCLALAPLVSKTQLQTSTVQVIDDKDETRSLRPVSALHARLSKPAPA